MCLQPAVRAAGDVLVAEYTQAVSALVVRVHASAAMTVEPLFELFRAACRSTCFVSNSRRRPARARLSLTRS